MGVGEVFEGDQQVVLTPKDPAEAGQHRVAGEFGRRMPASEVNGVVRLAVSRGGRADFGCVAETALLFESLPPWDACVASVEGDQRADDFRGVFEDCQALVIAELDVFDASREVVFSQGGRFGS